MDLIKTNKTKPRSTWIIGLSLIIVIMVIGFLISKFPIWLISIHQNRIAEGIIQLGQKTSTIKNQKDATRAVELLSNINFLYEISIQYQGTQQSSQKLQSVRDQTMLSITTALKEYSGLNYGLDVEKWERWLETASDFQPIPCLES